MEENSIYFVSLASGSSGNCYYFGHRDFGFLIDVGIPYRTIHKKLKDIGLSIECVRAVFITHNHWDHIKAVDSFASKVHVPIYALPSVKKCICSHNRFNNALKAVDIKEIELNEIITIENFSVMPFFVPHDSDGNCGYSIEFNDKRFTLATDIGTPTDELRSLILQSDYLVIEANHDVDMLKKGPYPQELKDRVLSDIGHLSNKMLAEVLKECITDRLIRIFLCHLSEKNNTPELALHTIVQAIDRTVTVKVLDRRDTQKFELCRR